MRPPGKFEVNIEEVLLQGVPVADRAAFADALQRGLSSLLSTGAPPPPGLAGDAARSVYAAIRDRMPRGNIDK